MESTKAFKETIKAYLDQRAQEDSLFAVSYVKEKKNINDCIIYILNTVQQSKCNGFADDEIYSMAVHYYDEDNIKIGSNINCKVVVNHSIKHADTKREKVRTTKKDNDVNQLSLF